MNYLMKAKYDADKMLADCLNKQTKVHSRKENITEQQTTLTAIFHSITL